VAIKGGAIIKKNNFGLSWATLGQLGLARSPARVQFKIEKMKIEDFLVENLFHPTVHVAGFFINKIEPP
jgi:hypothetical protein